MSVRRAIETILQSNNLELREIDEKTLMVMTLAKARSFEGKAVKVITTGVPVNTIKNMIEKAVAKEMIERFTIFEDLGNLVLTGDREAVDEIEVLIKNFDEKFIVAGEGLVREYFQPVNTKTDELIALIKEALSENESIKISHDKRTDMLLLIGAKESVKRAVEIVKQLDKPRTRQALIHIRLVEVHRTELEELGIKLPSTLASTDDIGNISRENYVIPAELVGTIEKSKVKTLANPTIRCMDKEEALIDISEQIPVKNTVTEYLPVASASLAARTSDNWTTSDIGIKMNVKPTIHINDEISMDVDIDQTELISLVEGHPWTAKRQIKTKVRIKDRETVVIGGLIRSKKGKTRKPVPILSRIPLIKNLVRAVEHRNENDEKTEL
ncbi:MAG: secretin N-terminal domain-containing protein, partial [Candidatus Riflebacteria bacterium]